MRKKKKIELTGEKDYDYGDDNNDDYNYDNKDDKEERG